MSRTRLIGVGLVLSYVCYEMFWFIHFSNMLFDPDKKVRTSFKLAGQNTIRNHFVDWEMNQMIGRDVYLRFDQTVLEPLPMNKRMTTLSQMICKKQKELIIHIYHRFVRNSRWRYSGKEWKKRNFN